MADIDLSFGLGSTPNTSKANQTKSQQKQAQVSQTSMLKQLQFGSQDYLRTLATAAQQGNNIGSTEFIQDMTNLSDTDIAAKYGFDAVQQRQNYLNEFARVQQDKASTGTNIDAINDLSASAVQGGVNTVGAVGSLAASAWDMVTAGPRALQEEIYGRSSKPVSETYAEGLNWVNEELQGLKSDYSQEKREQFALEQELDAQDRQAEFEASDKGVLDQLANEGKGFWDTVQNFVDNPSVGAETIAEGIGSLGPMAKSVQALARVRVTQGMSKSQAATFLNSEAGKAALSAEAIKLVPTITALTEGGSAGLQARQEILAMSEQELAQSPEYRTMRENGLSHEQARSKIIELAGRPAELTGATLGLITGRIARSFEANPTAVGSVREGLTTVAKEGVEEALQEGSNQLASNVGLNTAGFDRDLTEGVGEGAAAGLVGGVGTAGVTQAPGAALGATVTTAQTLGGVASSAYQAQVEAINKKREDNSPVGQKALQGASEQIRKDATEISLTNKEGVVSDQSTPNALQSKIDQTIWFDDAKSQEYMQIFPALAEIAEKDGRLDRNSVILAMGDVVSNKDLTDADKTPFAIETMKIFDELRSADSTETTQALNDLDADSPVRKRFTRLARNINKLESSTVIQRAREIVEKLDETQIKDMFADGLAEIQAGNLTSESAEGTVQALNVISRYNPFAVPKDAYDLVLEQVGSTQTSRGIEVARSMVELVEEAESAKADIAAEQDAAFAKAGLDESQKHRTKADVRNDILLDNNAKNQKLSVWNHRMGVLDNMAAGRQEEAIDNAEEMKNFALSMINKANAFNIAAQNKIVNLEQGGVTYDAYGDGAFFEQKGVWFNRKAPQSVALARDVHVDAQTVVGAYNALVQAYPELGLETLEAPKLSPAILGATSAPIETDPAPVETPERRIRKDATVKASESLLDEDRSEVGERIKDSTKRKRALYERTTPRKRPLVDELIGAGITIDPNGVIGRELTALGIEKKDVPGLLKDGGLDEIDNIPFGDIEYLSEVIPADDTGNYYDRQALLDAIISEASGNPVQNADEIALSRTKEEAEQTTPNQTEPEQTEEEAEADYDAALKKEADQITEEEPVESETRVEAEPEPEVIAEDTVTEEETETPQSLSEIFSDLTKDAEDRNYFLSAFKLAQGKSSFLGSEDSFQSVLDRKDLTDGVKAQVKFIKKNLIDDVTEALNTTLDEELNKTRGGKRAGSRVSVIAEDLETGMADVLGYANALSLNLTRQKEDGSREFHPKVVEAFTMATVEWMVETENKGLPIFDDEDIRKRLNLAEDAQITKAMRKAVKHGPVTQSALDQISQAAMQLMGVTADKSQPVKHTQGIFRSMAANMLDEFANTGWLDIPAPLKYQSKEGVRSYVPVKVNRKMKAADGIVEGLKTNSDVFKETFLEEFDKPFSIGTPPTSAPQNILGQRANKVTALERKVVKRLQSTPHRFVAPMIEFLDAIGDDAFKAIAGYQDLKDTKLNENAAERVDSRNRSIERGLNGVRTLMEKTQKYADETSGNVYTTDTFFNWEVSSVGRLQQQGLVTPQGDKIAREMISATHSVLDLDNPEHFAAVWLGVAQAFDMSVEKKSHEATIAEIQELMDSETGLKPAVDMVREWAATGEFKDGSALVDALTNARDKDGEPLEITVKALHALVTVGRMYEAIENGTEDKNQFGTALALEADGKTDGPINAVINMGFGEFTPHQIEVMAKGGLFFSGSAMSLNRYIEGGDGWAGDKADLYQVAAALFEEKLRSTYSDGAPPVLSVMDTFLPGFAFQEGKFQIGRNVIKNPLTVFLYGSSAKGIAAKMASAVTSELYDLLSDIADRNIPWNEHPKFKENDQLINDMVSIFGNGIYDVLKDPIKGTLTKEMEAALTDRILDATGEALEDSIDEATGGLREAMQLIRTASQIQAIVFQDAYKSAVNEARGNRPASELSEKEYADIFEAASKVAPIYFTEGQEFHIAASEQYSSATTISTSLSGRLSSGSTVPMPQDVGVKVQPYLVIGTGDGKMILNIYDGSNADLDRSLPVFDGVEMALDTVTSASLQINESVWKGWQEESVATNVLDGYQQFLRNADLSKLSEPARKDLVKLAKRYDMTLDQLLKSVETELTRKAVQNKARKTAMSQVNAWVDHMAGADAPYENQGDVVETPNVIDPQLISNKLNRLYNRELEKQRETVRAKKAAPEIQKPTRELLSFLKGQGSEVDGTSVLQISGSKLAAAISENKGFSKDQVSLFQDLLAQDEDLSEFSFFFGSSEELNVVREDKLGLIGQKEIENGVIYPAAKAAFISNASPETVLHEIVHVATVKSITDFYNDRDNAPEHVAAAMTRLEDLMSTFEGMNFAKDTGEDKAARVLQEELSRYADQPIHKMSEFLAWTLSNQNLIKIGKDTRVYSPIQKITMRVLKALKELLGLTSYKGRDLFSNIRFNAEVVIRGSKLENRDFAAAKAEAETVAVFEQTYGHDPRMSALERKFFARIYAAMEAARDKVKDRDEVRQKKAYAAKYVELKEQAIKATERVEAEGFLMNQREKSMFQAVHASMMSGMEMNPAAKRRAYELYSHLVKNAKPGTLGVLVGKGGIRKNAEGQSDLLATFVALGTVHKGFQFELSKIDGPKNVEKGYSTLDEGLRHGANTIINYLTQSAIGLQNTGPDLRSQLAALEDVLASIQTERRSAAERLIMRPQEILDQKLSGLLDKGSKKAVEYIKSKRKKTDGPLKSGAFISAQFIAALGSKEETANVGEALRTMLNENDRFLFLRELVSDLQGVTKSNEALLDLVNKVKSHIDALRQDYRERVPVILAEKFSRKLKRQEWTQLYEGIAQTDLVTLGRKQTVALLKDMSQLPAEIRGAEERLQKLAGKRASIYKEKSNALAHWMVNKEVISNNLLRNAEAIARLLGESAQVTDPDPDLVAAIDELTTLYALDKTSQETKDKLQELAQTEEEGLTFLVGYQFSTRALEMDRIATGTEGEVSKLNGWKGYAPAATANGHSLIVADDSKNTELVKLGYVRVGDYTGDSNEGYRGSRGYYQSTVGGKSAYRQGVAQTVHSTYQGVDPRTGRSQTGEMAGYVYGKKAQRIQRSIGRIKNTLPADTHLIPIFGSDGNVVAYERTMDPKKREALQQDKHMARMLGVWSGRIVEETQSDMFNKQLVQTLKDLWEEARKSGEESQFINVADPGVKDPVIRDAWDTMGWKLKDNAAEIFGEKTLMIRKDMVNDALGFHQASVRDAWTGVSRWSPEAQNAIREAATVIMGDNAYKYMVKAETAVTEVVSMAKTTIVVRSLTVIWENLISNNLHLMTWGVGPLQLVKQQRAKFLEINQYVQNQSKILELNAELAANIDNPAKARRINAELQVLEDANNNLSIKPLLDAGEFSTVSESLTEQDQALREGKLEEYLDWAADKLPGPAQTAFKNFVITKDTALFQGLNRAVQYGDFVAKAVLYEHLMKEKGYSQKEAMDVIKEEFVNYNRLAGRDRDYLEATGMLWFMNYKIRIMKVMTRLVRERPASALFYAGGVGPMADIDTVVSGSGLGAYLDNRLGYAIGPEMGYNGLFMNPWMNLVD